MLSYPTDETARAIGPTLPLSLIGFGLAHRVGVLHRATSFVVIMTSASSRTMTSSLDKLKISQGSKKAAPAESWEDEADDSSDTETESQPNSPARPMSSHDYPGPPPPTPSSPSFRTKATADSSPYQTFPPYGLDGASDLKIPLPSRGGGDDDRRPDKSTSTASRLIAAGIGQKAPKRTKEQREYDQAMKVQEKKKRDQLKDEEARRKEAAERAKRDVWGD